MNTESSREKTVATDPVCGMKVNRKAAPATTNYQGITYYFCAVACRETFERDPDRYVRRLENRKSDHPIEDKDQ